MEMQVQSDSRIFLPGCAARRRIAGPCAPAGRRGAGTGLAAATGHVPSAQPPPRPPPPLPCTAAAPPPNPNSHQEEGAAPPPHPAPAAGGSGAASSPSPPPGTCPGCPGGSAPPSRTGRGTREGQHRRRPPRSRCSRRLGPGGVKRCCDCR